MIVDISISKTPEKHLVIDLDKKEVIRGVQWANDETGMYVKRNRDNEGNFISQYCPITKQFEVERLKIKGNILIVKSNGITTLQK